MRNNGCKFVVLPAGKVTDIDFAMNPRNPCITSEFVDGKKVKICWRVGGLKASHVKSKVMDRMIGCLCQEHKSVFKGGSGATVW